MHAWNANRTQKVRKNQIKRIVFDRKRSHEKTSNINERELENQCVCYNPLRFVYEIAFRTNTFGKDEIQKAISVDVCVRFGDSAF